MSIWAFPLITALVAGDIVAAESHNGTLKTILTRSRNRGEIYAGEGARDASRTRLSWSFAMGAVAFIAASIAWGFNPSPRSPGTTRRARGTALGLLAGEPRGLRVADGRDRGVRDAPLDGHPQQRGVRRRDADVGAADAAARRAAGHRADPPVPARRRSSRRGTASCARLPTGCRSCARSGSARSTSRSRSPPATSSSCAATSRASSPLHRGQVLRGHDLTPNDVTKVQQTIHRSVETVIVACTGVGRRAMARRQTTGLRAGTLAG